MINMASIIKQFDPNDMLDKVNTKTNIWIHRCGSMNFYINYLHYENNLPLIISYDEITTALAEGKKVIGCDLCECLFDESKTETIEKLNNNGIAYEYALMHFRERILEIVKNYLEYGIYMIYNNLDRTATPCTESNLNKILYSENFGWNGSRGTQNIALILNIPLECFQEENKQQLYEKLDGPEIVTQFCGTVKVEKVIPKQYIKEIVYQCGKEIIRIHNNGYDEHYIPMPSDDINLYEGTSITSSKKI